MKKRLLITSIVMMLVVAVALSTATYAWFTSNDTVNATSITLTAANSDGVALAISWNGGTPGTTISATNEAPSALHPIMPATLNSETTSAVTFTGGSTYMKNGVNTFKELYTETDDDAYVFSGTVSSSSVDVIKLTNLSAAGGKDIASVTITPTIAASTEEGYSSKDASSLVRIAIFYSADNTTYTLIGVLGNAANLDTVYGTATADKAVGTGAEATADKANVCVQGKATTVATTTLPQTSGVAIAANSSVYLKVIMWMDGAAFTDAFASYKATASLEFKAA